MTGKQSAKIEASPKEWFDHSVFNTNSIKRNMAFFPTLTIYLILTAILVLFQAGLAAGAPWGAASMGGKYPGRYPRKMRIVAVVNIVVLLFFAAIVSSRAGLIFAQHKPFSGIAIWAVAAFFFSGTILNTITPSRIERIWAPVALALCVSTVVIALG